MILEEIAGVFLSFVSYFMSDYFRVAQRGNTELNDTAGDVVNSEHDETGESSSTTGEQLLPPRHDYGTVESRGCSTPITRPGLCKSFCRSAWISFTILVAVLPHGLLSTVLLYADLNSVNLCSDWIQHQKRKAPVEVMRWKLIGDVSEDFLIYFWFPFTMVFLFGWQEFKSSHLFTMFVAFNLGCTNIIYKSLFFIFDPNAQNTMYYHFPANVIFLVGLLYSSYLVATKVCKNHCFMQVTLSRITIMITVMIQFFFAFVVAMAYRYALVPLFNRINNDLLKASIAAITPLSALIPVAVCRHFALLSIQFAKPENSFILVYFVYGSMVIVYRVMQADVKNIWLFMGLSVLHNFVRVVGKATEKVRYKVWTRIFHCLKQLWCCRRIEQQLHNTQHDRQLNADKEIQTILYNYSAMILSHIYLALYMIINFEVSSWAVLSKALKRICIGLGIDYFFNCFSILIHTHWYGIPVQRVWMKHWKRHLLANFVTTAMTIGYFSPVLLTVVQVHVNNPEASFLKNCTVPYKEY